MLPGLSTGGGSFSGSSTARSGDIGAHIFGPTGGLTFSSKSGIDERWLIGGVVLTALFIAAALARRKG